MRCNPLRWLWGSVLVIGLLGIMNLQGVLTLIESDLQRQTNAALEKAGLGWANVNFRGRDARLAGKATDESEQRRAWDITRSQWGVRTVDSRMELIEEQKNYVWSAMLRDSRLRLVGFVPNESTRRAIIGAAKATFPQLEIDDRMRLARGAPETEVWLGSVSFGLKQLSGLKAGSRVDLDSFGLSVEGEAEDFAAYRALKGALSGNVPQGLKIKSDRVVPPVAKPFVWVARLTANQIQLSGFVPSEKVREQVSSVVQKDFGQRVIVDRMQIASGEPRDVLPAILGALQALAQFEEGVAELRDSQLQLSGTVAKQETAEAVRTSLRNLPDSVKVGDQIKFREPTVKTVSPYTLSAVLEGPSIILSGYVPSETARTALTGLVQSRFPNSKLTDSLLLGAGAPDGLQACMAAGLTGLSRLGNGRIDIENRTMRFAAVTDDEELAEAIRGEVRAAANRACDPEFGIVVNAPPEPLLNWRVVSQGGELMLEGEVPDESTRSELALTAARLFPKSRLVDRTEVKPAYSKKWPKVTDTGLKVLARLRSGEVRLAGHELIVSGQAPDTAVATAVRQQLRDLPKGYTGRDVIEVRSDAMIWAEQEAKRKAEADARRKAEEARQAEEARRKADEEARAKADREADERRRSEAERQEARQPDAQPVNPPTQSAPAPVQSAPAQAPAQQQAALSPPAAEPDRCRDAPTVAQQWNSVLFDRASASLPNDGLDALSRLAALATRCPGLRFEIEGHTDAEGTPERNQTLSERRAEATAAFLNSRGVPADRLTTVGYGASRPLVTNDTPENRSRNRRVHINVLMP